MRRDDPDKKGTCETCGTAKSVRQGRKYCSPECYGAAKRAAAATRRGRVECVECGTAFTPRLRTERDHQQQKYCSVACRDVAARTQPVERLCERCGDSFVVRPCESAFRFCSPQCRYGQVELPPPVRRGYIWTGPELELVATRDDLSISQLAAMLGRTRAGVMGARHRVRNDPKWMLVAGVGSQ